MKKIENYVILGPKKAIFDPKITHFSPKIDVKSALSSQFFDCWGHKFAENPFYYVSTSF